MLQSRDIYPIKLTDLADDLNIKLSRLLTHLRNNDIQVLMFLRNGIKQQLIVFRDQQGEEHPDSFPEDDEHFDSIYYPVSKHAINCLIDNGTFEFDTYSRDTGHERGEKVFCLKDDGFSVQKDTVISTENLYISKIDAEELIKFAGTDKGTIESISTSEKETARRSELPPLDPMKAIVGWKAIAEEIGISVDYAKDYCKRNGIRVEHNKAGKPWTTLEEIARSRTTK